MAATRDAFAERLPSVRDITSLLYNRMMENIGYGQQERLKDIVEKEEEEQPTETKEEVKEQHDDDDDDERYDTVTKMKLVRAGRRVKEFMVTGKLNRSNKHKDDHGQYNITN